MNKFFRAPNESEGGPQMDAGQNHCIFTVPRATARLATYLQGGRPQGATIPYNYAVILFCERPRSRRGQDGICSPSWGVPWGQKRLPKKVLKTQGAHQSSHKTESLHICSVPWPHRRGQKSEKKVVIKLTTFLAEAVFKVQVDRWLGPLHF